MKYPSIRVRVDFGPNAVAGPGKIALFEQIARAGSLSKAARDNGMSYRRAWQLLESLNSSFSERVAVTRMGGYGGGGGVTLTSFGKLLIWLYRAFESEIHTCAIKHFGRFRGVTALHDTGMGVLPLVKKLDDALGHFLVQITCKCGATQTTEPEALARLCGSSATLEAVGKRMRCSKCGAKGAQVVAISIPRLRGRGFRPLTTSDFVTGAAFLWGGFSHPRTGKGILRISRPFWGRRQRASTASRERR